MCFSATASFTAAAVLAGVGAATLAQRPAPGETAFAAIPLIFAVHQAIEGVIWTTLPAAPSQALVIAWLAIAQVLWPTYVPLAVLMMEKNRRRPGLWALLAAGLFVSGALALILIRHPYTVTATGDGLRYATDLLFETRLLALYFLATVAPLFLSRRPFVVVFGAATLAGAAATVAAFYLASASVWCFFAAIASVFVFFHQRRMKRLRAAR